MSFSGKYYFRRNVFGKISYSGKSCFSLRSNRIPFLTTQFSFLTSCVSLLTLHFSFFSHLFHHLSNILLAFLSLLIFLILNSYNSLLASNLFNFTFHIWFLTSHIKFLISHVSLLTSQLSHSPTYFSSFTFCFSLFIFHISFLTSRFSLFISYFWHLDFHFSLTIFPSHFAFFAYHSLLIFLTILLIIKLFMTHALIKLLLALPSIPNGSVLASMQS